MSDLVAWLLEQVAEDETAARPCVTDEHPAEWIGGKESGHPWRFETSGVFADVDGIASASPLIAAVRDADWERHIARWDPARVLAECAAKRAILDLHCPDQDIPRLCQVCGCPDCAGVTYPCSTLLALAQPYAGRPGWREEWRVEP